MRLHPTLFAICLIACPFSVVAQTTCNFTLECLIGEACAETVFNVQLTNGQLISDAETITGTATQSGFVSAPDTSVGHWITIQPSGTAYYSVHMPDAELILNYTGTCEAVK